MSKYKCNKCNFSCNKYNYFLNHINKIHKNKIYINYIFSIGRRCNSVEFLRKFKLTKFSSPFDWMFIDFETSLININNNFENFLNDLIIFNKNKNIMNLFNDKNFNKVNNEFSNLITKNIRYMSDNYNSHKLIINQNYIDEILDENIYKWEKLCLFLHNDISDEKIIKKIQKRINIFNYIIINNSNNTLLFYVSHIITNLKKYKDTVLSIINKYKINTYFVIVLCCVNEIEHHIFENNCLLIVKNVPLYKKQIIIGKKTDNNIKSINFDDVYLFIKRYFDINLFDKPII